MGPVVIEEQHGCLAIFTSAEVAVSILPVRLVLCRASKLRGRLAGGMNWKLIQDKSMLIGTGKEIRFRTYDRVGHNIDPIFR